MNNEYRQVKPKRKEYVYVGCIFAAAVAIVILFIRQWTALFIPLLFLTISLLYLKNDRILYNRQEIVLFFPPMGKAFHFSWYDITSVELCYETKRGRTGYDSYWWLKITFTNDNVKSETLRKLYNNYDGISEFIDFYMMVKGFDQE